MSANPITLTPKERLANSRKALLSYMTLEDNGATEKQNIDAEGRTRSTSQGKWFMAKHALKSWWRHHPANMVFDVAKPFMGNYAQENPLKLISIAVAVGAAAVFLRPWRLISLGVVLRTALKSSEFSSVLHSVGRSITPTNNRLKSKA